MKNARELRDELSLVFQQLKSGDMTPQEAAEMANIAGKMINSARAQIEYYTLRKEVPTIAFLADDKEGGDAR